MKIPPNVVCFEAQSLLIWRPRGILNENIVNEILAFLDDRETKLEKTFNRFTDLSSLDAVDLSFKYVFQVALFRRLALMGHSAVKSAFFVLAPEVARYVKVHALVTDHSPLVVAMFDDRAAAAEWLGVSPAMLVEEPER